ncbi:poly [ADP-ribose] polymerase 9 [Oryzias latipes]|uniref:Poly [ADP-ribose] polymerase n=1 Tax=Oryzias latipes TaxID=8090 RepID=A0A3B3I0B0_ORYLA|nr:poly [ADP-ribose] polymerase 9 [Oryzias latipes]XP_011488251.1 poly [ADP-ribose] polymerase 9 [Oryzias latipes]
MEEKVEIPLEDFPFIQRYREDLSEVINSKFGCVVTFEGVDGAFSGTKYSKAPVKPEKRSEHTLSSGVVVSVWKADLSCFGPAEAVVNAANSHLSHGGGLAQALSDAGGPQIQQDSQDHIKYHGPLKKGDAVVLNAGLLPYKKIIHAVGPDLSFNPSRSDVKDAEPLLRKAIENILKRVAEERLSSVAIPAVSSGLFYYPLPECAQTIVSTVKSYLEGPSNGKHRPKEVFFVNNDEPTVREMERACRQILGSGPSSYSNAVQNTRGASRDQDLTVQIGQVSLTLKMELIQDQQTDVIVNTASENRDLKLGGVSKALLQKAGSKMQNELYSAKQNRYIISTKGYNLMCKDVYHTFCVHKRDRDSQKILSQSVTECLWTAASAQHKSISFPAIGTGNLGFSETEAARIMLDAVQNFSQNCPSPMAVYFVIHHSDQKVFQAFKDEMKNIQKQSPKPNFEQATQITDFSPSSRKPQITLEGPSKESTREAEKWLKDLLNASSQVIIYNNFIQHFGKKESQLLYRWNSDGVSIKLFLSQGHACITIESKSKEKLVGAVVKVEAMLCRVRRDFVSEEEKELQLLSDTKGPFRREPVHKDSTEFSHQYSAFSDHSLHVLKVERVKNPALEVMFDIKKVQMSCSTTQRMFQCISAQFCDTICKIGFHAECAPPEDPLYGEGIYFTDSIKEALKVWRRKKEEEFVYFVEAEVLTGKSTKGERGLILPPPVGKDPDKLFDSVSGGYGTSVIFSGYQALPRFIITCQRR